MDSRGLRAAYLDYFRREGHSVLPSSGLVPDDPTLLFTSAGMVQFKDIFWGRTPPAQPRAATCQKCFRTTDIERVGTTAYHHTFFEMLGNFSFGDYFKEGAIELAWRFLTGELGMPADRLWVSVFQDDDEAAALWRKIAGLPEERIVRLGKEHNWWGPVGDRGPCGPDTEIFWDWGEQHGCGPRCAGPACDCDRFSEIWNLVFMQHDVQPDGTLAPLTRRSIDTGMGLERTTAVLEGVISNFDTDLFRPIAERIEVLAKRELATEHLVHRNVIADHIRGAVFLISSGVLPDSEQSRGSVLRKLFIRMLLAADALGLPDGALAQLVEPVLQTLGEVYHEIMERRPLIERVLPAEEATYRRRLGSLERLASQLPADAQEIPGKTLFAWYDSHGIPLELVEAIAAERGLQVDLEGFEREMEQQRARSKRAVESEDRLVISEAAEVLRKALFVGYDRTVEEWPLEVILDAEGAPRRQAEKGYWQFIFGQTPFYAEAGGQIADTGWIENLDRSGKAEVLDVQIAAQGTFHKVRITSGKFHSGDRCRLTVDAARRRAIQRAHTATHLLHAALRHVLGEHVIQSGSWVAPDELRFDFTHFSALTWEELEQVEALAQAAVLEDKPIEVTEMPLEEARARGAIAHFEEEYRGKTDVRVVGIPETSQELCGGTHAHRTGEIGPVFVLAEEGVAAGTRRIRALVGEKARAYAAERRAERRALSETLGVSEAELQQGAARLRSELREVRKRLAEMEQALTARGAAELASQAEEVNGVRIFGTVVQGGSEQAKQLADELAARLGRCVVVIGSEAEGRGVVVAKVVDEARVPAGTLVRTAAAVLGGKGGGRPTFAQGGGPQAEELPRAVETALKEARSLLRSA